MKQILVGLVVAAIVFAAGWKFIKDRHADPLLFVEGEVATTEDIQEFDLFWNELEALQKESSKTGPAQFREEFVAKTIEFLALDAEHETEFRDNVEIALGRLASARMELKEARAKAAKDAANAEPADRNSWDNTPAETHETMQGAFANIQEEQRDASDLLLHALSPTPRHQLLAKQRLAWLMKLEYSIRTAERDT